MAILNGAKEAILDGDRHIYDSRQHMCCSLNLPVEAGAPKASPNDPLVGVYIALDPRVMTERTMEIESIGGIDAMSAEGAVVRGLSFAGWSPGFTEETLRFSGKPVSGKFTMQSLFVERVILLVRNQDNVAPVASAPVEILIKS